MLTRPQLVGVQGPARPVSLPPDTISLQMPLSSVPVLLRKSCPSHWGERIQNPGILRILRVRKRRGFLFSNVETHIRIVRK